MLLCFDNAAKNVGKMLGADVFTTPWPLFLDNFNCNNHNIGHKSRKLYIRIKRLKIWQEAMGGGATSWGGGEQHLELGLDRNQCLSGQP